ncbi:hypothetical protein Tco_1477158 [Tanacetum coccineum]
MSILRRVVRRWESFVTSNTGSVVATENTGSDVVGMENEDSDGDGTVNGGVGYGEVIVKHLILNLEYLSTATSRNHIFCFSSRVGKEHNSKVDEGFFIGYSINSKAFRVLNSRTRIVEENLLVQFSENTPNIAGSTKACDDARKARMETSSLDAGFKPLGDDEKKVTKELGKEGGDPSKEDERDDQEKDACVNSTNNVNAASTNKVNVTPSKWVAAE